MAVTNASGVAIAAPTPYITPDVLTGAPTGISWASVPNPRPDDGANYAGLLNLCRRATDWIDGKLNQPLRATTTVETLVGPGSFRFQTKPNGSVWLLLSRGPVTSIIGGRSTPATAFPPSWTTIAANQFRIEYPVVGVYGTTAPGAAGEGGQAVIMAPIASWVWGRQSTLIEVTYVPGWPHTSLTAAAAAAATSLAVDDITGWVGAYGTLYGPGGTQEVVTVSAATPTTTGATSGPGTLTVAATAYQHAAGTLLTTLPARAMQAAIYHCCGQALTRGATATVVQTVSGGTGGAGGARTAKEYMELAAEELKGLGRVI